MPKNNPSLGRSLIKAHKRRNNVAVREGFRHTADLPDGREACQLNLKSITEETSINDFLSQAELSEQKYNEEFSDIKFVDPDSHNTLLTEDERILASSIQDENKDLLCIPRRPLWNETTSKEELNDMEKAAFLAWRRKLASAQEEKFINFTPFEKNIEVWRQLWRVIERSDIVIQIIDARNPLLFRCPDLEAYIKEISPTKISMLLLNKADYLTDSERQCWCDYFNENGIQIAFFSALQEMERKEDEDITENSTESDLSDSTKIKNSNKVFSREQLIDFVKSVARANNIAENRFTVGLVGYPNVGKSSTINAILMSKKVSVSSTPGKTKHFQTFNIDEELCLCDCPGLVFPNFVSTKADMVINGILPIDQLTEWNQPVSLVTNLIPRHILETTYSIFIPVHPEKDPKSPPTAEEFLNAHGYNRGFMTKHGLPDNARSARYILKDYVNGKLLYCFAPPGVNQEEYHKFPVTNIKKKIGQMSLNENIEKKIVLSAADKQFFQQAHMKTNSRSKEMQGDDSSKPWKKHNNRNKKEKLRKVYYNNPYE